jgi:ADP-ribosylglycohydrolase
LGAGFYATEAVDMAMWAVNNSDDFEELLLNSICHNGDSDSVGAIAGGFWGLMTKEMPSKRLLDRVVEWPSIEKEALALLKVSGN